MGLPGVLGVSRGGGVWGGGDLGVVGSRGGGI